MIEAYRAEIRRLVDLITEEKWARQVYTILMVHQKQQEGEKHERV